MKQTTELQNEINKNKFINKTNSKLSNNIDLMQQLNTMQSEHIKVLEERINILKHTIEIDKITIQTQDKTIKIYTEYLNSKSNV